MRYWIGSGCGQAGDSGDTSHEKPCNAGVQDGGQNLCTRPQGHGSENGEDAEGHRCKAADVDARCTGSVTGGLGRRPN